MEEIKTSGGIHDVIRRKYLKKLYKKTGRNIIIYYSGWLNKRGLPKGALSITDEDKIGFMTTIHKLDRSKGLDLILHTPGGETAATESLVNCLHQMFETDIRVIVPELARSAGTMIACACKTIIMGKQSSLGPIDPQINGLPAHGIIEEFEKAKKECSQDHTCIPLWQPIIAHYNPTLIGECEKAILWSYEIVKKWLIEFMFQNDENAKEKADKIVELLGDHALTKSHARHLSADYCKEIGLKIEMMEKDQELQDAILSLHHACIHTLSSTPASKIIENHLGKAHITTVKSVAIPIPKIPTALPKQDFIELKPQKKVEKEK